MPPSSFLEKSNIGKLWYNYFLKEQLEAWKSTWEDDPDEDTLEIFKGRALYDAWATVKHNEEVKSTEPVYCYERHFYGDTDFDVHPFPWSCGESGWYFFYGYKHHELEWRLAGPFVEYEDAAEEREKKLYGFLD